MARSRSAWRRWSRENVRIRRGPGCSATTGRSGCPGPASEAACSKDASAADRSVWIRSCDNAGRPPSRHPPGPAAPPAPCAGEPPRHRHLSPGNEGSAPGGASTPPRPHGPVPGGSLGELSKVVLRGLAHQLRVPTSRTRVVSQSGLSTRRSTARRSAVDRGSRPPPARIKEFLQPLRRPHYSGRQGRYALECQGASARNGRGPVPQSAAAPSSFDRANRPSAVAGPGMRERSRTRAPPATRSHASLFGRRSWAWNSRSSASAARSYAPLASRYAVRTIAHLPHSDPAARADSGSDTSPGDAAVPIKPPRTDQVTPAAAGGRTAGVTAGEVAQPPCVLRSMGRCFRNGPPPDP